MEEAGFGSIAWVLTTKLQAQAGGWGSDFWRDCSPQWPVVVKRFGAALTERELSSRIVPSILIKYLHTGGGGGPRL